MAKICCLKIPVPNNSKTQWHNKSVYCLFRHLWVVRDPTHLGWPCLGWYQAVSQTRATPSVFPPQLLRSAVSWGMDFQWGKTDHKEQANFTEGFNVYACFPSTLAKANHRAKPNINGAKKINSTSHGKNCKLMWHRVWIERQVGKIWPIVPIFYFKLKQ